VGYEGITNTKEKRALVKFDRKKPSAEELCVELRAKVPGDIDWASLEENGKKYHKQGISFPSAGARLIAEALAGRKGLCLAHRPKLDKVDQAFEAIVLETFEALWSSVSRNSGTVRHADPIRVFSLSNF